MTGPIELEYAVVGKMCNMVVKKCLLYSKGWKPKIFYKYDGFFEKRKFFKSLRGQEEGK